MQNLQPASAGQKGRLQITNRGWTEEEINGKHQKHTAPAAASSDARRDAKLVCDNMKAISCRHGLCCVLQAQLSFSGFYMDQISQTTTLFYLFGCSQGWRSSSSAQQRDPRLRAAQQPPRRHTRGFPLLPAQGGSKRTRGILTMLPTPPHTQPPGQDRGLDAH